MPVLVDVESSDRILILAHGAGSHMEQKTIQWLAEMARPAGLDIVRFNFLYRALGRGMPDKMPTLVSTYRAVVEAVKARISPKQLIIGGHSMGGRVATVLESEGQTANGLITFGYPLHPPEQPEKLRATHLPLIVTPTLQINGTEDEFCTKELMDKVVSELDPAIWHLHWILGADHTYAAKKSFGRTRLNIEEEIKRELGAWLATLPR